MFLAFHGIHRASCLLMHFLYLCEIFERNDQFLSRISIFFLPILSLKEFEIRQEEG